MKRLLLKWKQRRIKPKQFYDSKLITELNKEHQELFSLYEQILKNYSDKKYKKTLKLLNKFHEKYHLHITKEDKQLYNFLIIKYRFFPDIQNYILEKQKEMQQITQSIKEFANKYNNIANIQKEEFIKDLQQLGEILTKRVEFEETELYEKY